jgi:hypothetical protein
MKRIVGAVFLSARFLLPDAAFAWSRSGHAAVALLAERRLSPRALLNVRAILGPNVGLAEIASCADGDPAPACGKTFKDDALRKDWHTIDIPVEDAPTAASLERYCRGNCVTDRINKSLNVLGDRDAPLARRRIALIYLVHFVGDVHQPLHCVVARLADGSPDPSAGRSPVAFMGWEGSLHWLWDNVIETPAVERARNARDLAERLESDMKGKDLESWKVGDLVSLAALESFQLAKETILPDYKRNGGREWGEDYGRRSRPIAYARLERAGVRLARMLETALGPA